MDINEILTIENGTLKAIVGQEYEELILPETIESIDNDVFNSVKIKKLVLPSSLEEIAGQNFKDAVSICEIVVSEGTEIISDEAFMNCTSLEKITLPSSANEIGQGILKGCKKLSEAVIHTTAFFPTTNRKKKRYRQV